MGHKSGGIALYCTSPAARQMEQGARLRKMEFAGRVVESWVRYLKPSHSAARLLPNMKQGNNIFKVDVWRCCVRLSCFSAPQSSFSNFSMNWGPWFRGYWRPNIGFDFRESFLQHLNSTDFSSYTYTLNVLPLYNTTLSIKANLHTIHNYGRMVATNVFICIHVCHVQVE